MPKVKRKPKATARLMHKITTLTGYQFRGPVDGWVVLKYRPTTGQQQAGHWLWRLTNELDSAAPGVGSTYRIASVLAATELAIIGDRLDREIVVER